MLSLKSWLFLFSFFVFNSAQAVEFFEPFQSTRQLGMGGVYVFNETDAGGFIQNPAYTCYNKGMNWSLFNFGIGVGDVQAYNQLTKDTGKLPDPSGFADLAPFYGKNVWLGLDGYTSFTVPCFGFAGTGTAIANFQLHNPAFPTLRTVYLKEYGVRIGGAIAFNPVFSLGLDVKRMDRAGGPKNLGPSTLTSLTGSNAIENLVSNFQNEGIGYGLDAGIVSRFSMLPFNPTLSLSWRDVGSTAYSLTKGTDAPERQKDNLVASATIDGSIPLLGLAAGVEYRHITDDDEQLGKKLHIGAEASLAFLDLRAGFYQGYATYGAGVNLWLLQFDAAWYRVEKGAYPGQTPDERVQLGIMMDLEFDPNFNFVDAGGRKRRLKQRR